MPEQVWETGRYVANAAFVADLGQAVLDMLAPRPGERILDLGCGDGRLTARIAALGADVVGADSSLDLAASARAKGFEVALVDGHALPFDNEFDAVFSNAALHWMKRPDEVIAGVRRALKPGGRFVAEMGGHGCVAAIATALLAVLARHGIDGTARWPWYFPTVADYRGRLEAGGFRVRDIALVPRPTPLPTEIHGWLDTFADPFLGGFEAEHRQMMVAEVAALVAPSLRDERGNWTADYMRLRFAAIRA